MNPPPRALANAVREHLTGASPSFDATLSARPFVYRDPSTIPARQWLYRPSLIRGFVSLTVSPGGVGKSTLALCEGLAICTGRPLLGIAPSERVKVWIWNGEDPAEEMERRIHAAMIHHGLSQQDVEGRLFIGSGRDADMKVAVQDRGDVTVQDALIEGLNIYIQKNEIRLVVIDPFVSSHGVSENDNLAIDTVVKLWGRIAHRTGCAVSLVHHTRKTGGADVTVEDGRGASALLAGARHARTLRTMNANEAGEMGIEPADRFRYVRIDDGKANMTPRAGTAAWFQLANVHLPNGDYVQAAAAWDAPDPYEVVTPAQLAKVQDIIEGGRGETHQPWRKDCQAGEAWAGYAVAKALVLDLSSPRDVGQAKALLKTWIASGALRIERQSKDKKGNLAPFVLVGRRH